MPDPTDFNSSAFTSPQQMELMRRYAAQLLEPLKPEDISHHWTGALAAALRGALGPMVANRAAQLQGLGVQQYGQKYGAGVEQMGQQGAPTSVPGQSAQPMSFVGTPDLKNSILMQESGNRSNIGPSVAGAIGPGQIMPATFSQFARPGEDINNPNTNRDVSGRILDKYNTDYGGDIARTAVAYFSGPGNVAPPGNPTPWKRDVADQNGKHVSSYVSDVVGRTRGPQVAQGAVDPRLLGSIEADPWGSEASKQPFRDLVAPKVGEDVYGRPTSTTQQYGTRGLPVTGATPGYRAPATVGPEGAISTTVPYPASGARGQGLQGQMQPLMDVAKSMGQQGAVLSGTRKQIGEDIQQAYATIPIIQTLAQMKDTIQAHGDKMIWGPTSDWLNNLRKALAQHAPGFLSKKDLEGIAAADDFDKLSAQLQTIVGRQAGATDMSLLQGIKSVPGSHNSREGAMALIDMLIQTASLNGQFMAQNQHKIGNIDPATGKTFDLLAAKNAFFENNPLTNPITRNPIRMELSKKQTGMESKVINGKTYTKINGVWHEGM